MINCSVYYHPDFASTMLSFSIIDVSTPTILPPGTPFNIPISFTPGHTSSRSAASTRLDLTFKVANGAIIVISKTLQANVGLQSEASAAAQPTGPRPPALKRAALRPVGTVVVGPPTGYYSTIPYIKYLPEYPFDTAVVSEGSYVQRLAFLRALLPEGFNDAGYARHWATLLHAEEHQMRFVYRFDPRERTTDGPLRLDMEAYTMYEVDLEPSGKTFL